MCRKADRPLGGFREAGSPALARTPQSAGSSFCTPSGSHGPVDRYAPQPARVETHRCRVPRGAARRFSVARVVRAGWFGSGSTVGSTALHGLGDGSLCFGELAGRAELDELGALFGFRRVAGWHVKGVAGLDDLLAVGVANKQSALEHVTPVWTGAVPARERRQHRAEIVALGDGDEVDGVAVEVRGPVDRYAVVGHLVGARTRCFAHRRSFRSVLDRTIRARFRPVMGRIPHLWAARRKAAA